MKLDELGVGKITKQNTTVDVKPGETERQAKKLGLVNGKPKLLHKTAAKNSTPNKLFNLGLTEGYGKDVDEKFIKDTIKHFAKKYGINEKIALAVWRSEGGMNWQSKLKPKSKKVKTDGGQEASYGPFQLYTGKGGLGSAWEKLTGKKLSSSTSQKDIASQIDFALKTVPNRGWQDFKGANRVGINQYDGVPTKNNPMYKNLPIPKPTNAKSKDMYNKVDKIKTQPSLLDPRPLGKAIKNTATDLYKQGKKELGNIEVDKDSFTYKNVVEPAGKAYDYISKGFTGFMKDLKKSPEYKAAGEKNKKLYGPKNTVTELVIPTNDTQHAIERLKVAAELCNKMGNQPILYRAMHTGTYQGGTKQNLIQKVDNPARKGVMGNFNPIQKAVLEDLNIVSPAQATTVAPGSTSSYFGTNHIMIPGGDFTAYWNPDIDDLGGFKGYDPKYQRGAHDDKGGTLERGKGREDLPDEEMQKILSGYQKGIPSYSQHKGEVILDTPFYYMLNLQSFLSTFGGKKVKELITVQNKSTWSPISAELLASKFKTYSDIGWFLANPATNMMKWIASKEKTRSQESVKELKINKPDPKDTLGKKRSEMPQIKKQDYEEFIEYLQNNGAKFSKETVPASELKAMQSEFSDVGVIKQLQKNIDQGINSKAIIISDDDYVLDGHHRWLVAMNTGNDLDVYRVNIPAYKLFDLVTGFEKTYYKDMYETPGTIGVPLSSGLTVGIFPHRPLKIKKPTKGKLNYNEAFNNPYPIDWGGTDDPESERWVGNSKLEDGSLLTLEIASFDPGQFQIDFYRKDKTNVDTMKATGQGDEFRVFATVQKGILEWWESIDQDEVSRIEFSASKESDDSKNRHKLYARFAKQWADKIGWTATTGQEDDAVNFVLIRPNAAKFAKDQDLEVMEDLRDWFKQKWVNIGKKKKGGGYADCGTSGDKKGYAKCVPAKKAASMTKKEKESAVRRKRAAQNKKGRGGKKKAGSGKKPIRVKTKSDAFNTGNPVFEAWSQKKTNEAPLGMGSMELDADKVQQSIDYFYNDHAPNKIGGRKEEGSFKGLKVVSFTQAPDTLMFLVDNNDKAVFYVAYSQFEKGVAVGNVRSNGTVKATEVYAMLVDKFGTLYSDSKQTPQGAKIWTSLAKFYPNLAVKDTGDRLVATKKTNERELTKSEKSKMRKYEKKVPKADFIKRYGKKEGEAIYYGTITNMAKKASKKESIEEGKRIPRKKGQPAGSKKHSDLYTDENPKGTIHGLKFATVADAKASVSKIRNSGKKHAHKIQAAVAMEQRAKAAGKASAAAVYRTYINAMKKKTKKMNESLEEGVNDPHIFKAVFMAGGPGSGKSFVAKNLLGGTGLRPVNSDEVYEFLLKRQGLTLGPDDIASTQGQEIRGTAKDLTDKRQQNYIDGRLGLIIDGTGKVPELIQKLATQLKSIGYSVSMIFVNTSLEVAQQRNLERERTLPKDIVANSWNEVQQNLMKYQQIFGADRFHIIDNSGGLEDLDRTKNFDKVYNEVQRFINTPPKHKKALEWIQNQKAQNNARQTNSGKPDGGVANPN